MATQAGCRATCIDRIGIIHDLIASHTRRRFERCRRCCSIGIIAGIHFHLEKCVCVCVWCVCGVCGVCCVPSQPSDKFQQKSKKPNRPTKKKTHNSSSGAFGAFSNVFQEQRDIRSAAGVKLGRGA